MSYLAQTPNGSRRVEVSMSLETTTTSQGGRV